MAHTTNALYMVTVEQTRSSIFWVQAPTWSQAQEDAYGLADEIRDWEESETTVGLSVMNSARLSRDDEVWAGGAEGGWVSWKELQPKPPQTERLF